MLKDHNAVALVRLEPVALWSRVKHSTTEPLRSPVKRSIFCHLLRNLKMDVITQFYEVCKPLVVYQFYCMPYFLAHQFLHIFWLRNKKIDFLLCTLTIGLKMF